MKKSDVKKLKHGLYKIWWKKKHGGGTSLAAVGSLDDGRRWLAPTNWTACGFMPAVATHWHTVEKVKLIKA